MKKEGSKSLEERSNVGAIKTTGEVLARELGNLQSVVDEYTRAGITNVNSHFAYPAYGNFFRAAWIYYLKLSTIDTLSVYEDKLVDTHAVLKNDKHVCLLIVSDNRHDAKSYKCEKVK